MLAINREFYQYRTFIGKTYAALILAYFFDWFGQLYKKFWQRYSVPGKFFQNLFTFYSPL